MKARLRIFLKTAAICIACAAVFIGTGYFYLSSNSETVQNETESVPYYSAVPESAGVMFDILGDKTFFYLDFEKEILSVIYADEIETANDEIYGYPIDYTVSADYSLLGGIVDAVGGIDLNIEGEELAFTGVQVIELMETTVDRSSIRRETVNEIISKISEFGFDRELFLYIIENSDTDLTVPDCYYWSEHMKELCKLPRTVN